jgi:hypothetical protein
MVVDWMGMSRKFGGSTRDFYYKNKDKFILHSETEQFLEKYFNQ